MELQDLVLVLLSFGIVLNQTFLAMSPFLLLGMDSLPNDIVLTSFYVTLTQARIIWGKEIIIENSSIVLACRQICRASSSLMIDVREPSFGCHPWAGDPGWCEEAG